jgi:hypothetical protein
MHLRGQSVSIFDASPRKWKQTWVDNEGAYLDFVGEFKDGQMVLAREAMPPTAPKPCSAWCSRTSPTRSLTGAGKHRRTAASPGPWSGRFITSGKVDLRRQTSDFKPQVPADVRGTTPDSRFRSWRPHLRATKRGRECLAPCWQGCCESLRH